MTNESWFQALLYANVGLWVITFFIAMAIHHKYKTKE